MPFKIYSELQPRARIERPLSNTSALVRTRSRWMYPDRRPPFGIRSHTRNHLPWRHSAFYHTRRGLHSGQVSNGVIGRRDSELV